MGSTDFGVALESVQARLVLTAAAIKIQMLCKRAKARRRMQARKLEREVEGAPGTASISS